MKKWQQQVVGIVVILALFGLAVMAGTTTTPPIW